MNASIGNGLAAAAGSEQSGQLAGGVVTVTSLSAPKSPKDLETQGAGGAEHDAVDQGPAVLHFKFLPAC